MSRVRPALPLSALIGSLLLGLGAAPPGHAAELTTPYPMVRVEAGQTTTFDLSVLSDVREPVGLRVADAPDGWETVIRGDGREVESVYADPDEAAAAELEVRVPDDAEAGVHEIDLRASADSGNTTLNLRLRVVDQASDAYDLSTDYSTLRGSESDTYRFDLSLANHTAQEATFSLSAAGPDGWEVTASPSSEQRAAAATVDPGGTTTVAVEAKPPADVSAGTYELAVQASGQGATLQAPLTVEITGSPSLSLTTADERLSTSGTAGSTGTVTLVVRNDGNAPLEEVTLSDTPPSNWDVTFEPATIDAIGPGESAQATARITPTGDAVAGDYVVTLNSSAGEGASDSVEIRYAVETSTWWGLIGILVILAALGTLLLVYRRFGRR